jgi:carboxylesterase
MMRAVLPLAAALSSVNCAQVRGLDRIDTMPDEPRPAVMQGAEPVRIDRGRRRACLLVHGWLGTPADFAQLPAALDEAGWDVYVPRLPGHGTASRDLNGITARKLLDGARDHYQALLGRYEAVALTGFSMGGTIATILAAEEPPARLVLIAPFFRVRYKWYYVLPPRWWSAAFSPLVRSMKRPRWSVQCNRPEGRKEILTYLSFPTDANRALFELRRIALKDTDLSALRMPALLTYSTADNVCSPAATEAFFDKLPAAPKRKAVFKRSDHHILHDHDREQAIVAITEFLAGP